MGSCYAGAMGRIVLWRLRGAIANAGGFCSVLPGSAWFCSGSAWVLFWMPVPSWVLCRGSVQFWLRFCSGPLGSVQVLFRSGPGHVQVPALFRFCSGPARFLHHGRQPAHKKAGSESGNETNPINYRWCQVVITTVHRGEGHGKGPPITPCDVT